MRALVISDVHANAEALQAVLSRIRRKRVEGVICLGDFVGYGAAPNKVIQTMRTLRLRKMYVRGNHDRVAAGLDDGDGFSDQAREAALWTRRHLSPENRNFLGTLPAGPRMADNVLLCHGTPDDEDEYVFNVSAATFVFASHSARCIFYGHTHLPAVFSSDENGVVRSHDVSTGRPIRLEPRRRYLINPGSVGQPRDRNPLASFAIVDSERASLQFFRVAYDYEKTQRAIIRAGLPRAFADRLKMGA